MSRWRDRWFYNLKPSLQPLSTTTNHIPELLCWPPDLPAVTRTQLWASIILSHRDSEEKPANWMWERERRKIKSWKSWNSFPWLLLWLQWVWLSCKQTSDACYSFSLLCIDKSPCSMLHNETDIYNEPFIWLSFAAYPARRLWSRQG